jgi:hypothetical protein
MAECAEMSCIRDTMLRTGVNWSNKLELLPLGMMRPASRNWLFTRIWDCAEFGFAYGEIANYMELQNRAE